MTTQAAPAPGRTTAGTLLDGRVLYHQLADGYRTGIEPVLLAAAIPARPGDCVVEAGTGAGAGLLCLAARVAGLTGVGLEVDPALAALAGCNFMANGQAGLSVQAADVLQWRPPAPVDHAFANPPWHDPAGTASPVPGRRTAKQASAGLLAGWAAALGAGLRRGGTLSLILPAASLAEACAALSLAGCPQLRLLPLWPRMGQPAKLVIISGIREGRGGCVVLPGLVLHDPGGGNSAPTEAVLRHGAGL